MTSKEMIEKYEDYVKVFIEFKKLYQTVEIGLIDIIKNTKNEYVENAAYCELKNVMDRITRLEEYIDYDKEQINVLEENGD